MRLKNKKNLRKLFRNGYALFLAYDQGLEHGPADFNDMNVDPSNIIGIAKRNGFTGLIFQKGVAEKYIDDIRQSKVPLILKLNGKTNLYRGEPVSRQLATVEEAINLGAVAVGYTIYIGSANESLMLQEFEGIQRKAHEKSLPVIAWIYPRGSSVKGRRRKELLAYAARTGLEVGADIIKVQWDGKNPKDLLWAVKSAGKSKVIIAGGKKSDEKRLLKEIRDAKRVGISGLAIGRNIWQRKDPDKIAKKIKKIFEIK